MRRLHTVLVILFALVAISVPAKEKDRNWQRGTLMDTNQSTVYAGQVGHGSGTATTSGDTTYGNANGMSTAVYRVYQTYVIDSGDHVYTCQEHIKWKWSKPAMLTVNGPVEFVVEKDNVYIKGEDGSEHHAKLLKKVLKNSSESH